MEAVQIVGPSKAFIFGNGRGVGGGMRVFLGAGASRRVSCMDPFLYSPANRTPPKLPPACVALVGDDRILATERSSPSP